MVTKINEFGEIIRDGAEMQPTDISPEQEIQNEYNKLVYDLSHPERFSAEEYEQKKKRRTEIEQSGVKLSDDKSLAFKMAQLKVKAKLSGDNKTLLAGITRFKKQNG